MKMLLVASTLLLTLGTSAWSDEVSHRKATLQLLGLMDLRLQIKEGFLATLAPVFERSQKSGTPQVVTDDLRSAMSAWITDEKRMSELESLTCDLYMRELTEEDTNTALGLFKMPGGAKILRRLQIIAVEGIGVNEKFYEANQTEMQKVILAVLAKHKPDASK